MASLVLARTLERLSGDYEARWGHRVLLVETFVGPVRHRGTCYRAGGFAVLGETLGYGRTGGRYVHHGQPKLVLSRVLRRDATRILAAGFDHPLMARRGKDHPVLDLNALDVDGLVAHLEHVTDHRKRRGVRHSLASILAIGVAGHPVGRSGH